MDERPNQHQTDFEADFESAKRARYERLSLLTLDIAEAAGACARDKEGDIDPRQVSRAMAAISRAIWVHQTIERLREGKPLSRRELMHLAFGEHGFYQKSEIQTRNISLKDEMIAHGTIVHSSSVQSSRPETPECDDNGIDDKNIAHKKISHKKINHEKNAKKNNSGENIDCGLSEDKLAGDRLLMSLNSRTLLTGDGQLNDPQFFDPLKLFHHTGFESRCDEFVPP